MSKRRATEELYGDSAKRADQTGRGAEFTAHLRGLNSQFAQWAQQQAAQAGDQLWLAGVKDYIKHADKLLEQYDDVLVNEVQDQITSKGSQHRSSSPLASNLFGTPAPAANGPAADAAAAATGRSTGFGGGGGRKSVTFAEQPNFGAAGNSAAAATPGFGTAAGAATPGTANTANAGHTPVPASGLGYSFGATPAATPAAKGGELPSPEPFRLGGSVTPGSAGGAAAASTPGPSPSTGGFTFGSSAPTPAAGGSSGSGFGFTPAGAAAAAAAARATPPTTGGSGFSFGISSSSTLAGQDVAAAGTSSSTGGGFAFGAAPAAGSTGGFSFGASPASTTAAAAAADGSGPAATTFSFGALPSSSNAAAGGAGGSGSSPAFGFATTAAADNGTAGGGLFKFPAPSAAAGAADGAAAADAGDGDADDEAPPKFKPELKVDEETWKVLFSSKAKLYVRVRKEGASDWESRGVGTLTLRQTHGSTDKTYIMFSTDVGKQLVYSPLQNSTAVIPMPQTPKKFRMSLTVRQFNLPPAGQQADGAAAAASTKPDYQTQVCMLVMSTAEKVEEFSGLLEQHKPK